MQDHPVARPFTSPLADLLDRLAALEASLSRLAVDRAELRTEVAALRKRLDIAERRLNSPKMPL
jgi:phage shock protein A